MNQSGGADESDPTAHILRLLGGKWLAAAVSAAASLGVADALADKPLTLKELAKQVGAERDSLRRLMRVLGGEKIVTLNDERRYELTEAGALLQTGQLSDLAKFVGSPFSWDPWSSLAHSVRTGDSAFANRHGEGLFDYLEHHESEASLYHAAIDAFCQSEAHALAAAFDFSGSQRIVDIGGGQGTLLVEVLTEWKHLTGLLLEQPSAVPRARRAFEDAGLGDRCEARVGDFFVEIPSDGDVYVLKHIIHSWDDATAIDLLKRCASAVGPSGHVLVIEGLLLPEGHQNLTNLLDLEMLVLCGAGHERTKPDLRRLLSAAGLALESSSPLSGSARLFVTQPRG